ncbi:MAG: hypothetical protein ACK5IQ_11010 [Bacteroidales bacterium]
MKYIIILSALLISFNVFAEDNTKQAKLRQEAREFSLSVVQTYFDEDFNKYWSFVSDTIIILPANKVIPIADMKDALCSSLKRAIRNKDKTFQDYLDSYKVEILTKEELEDMFGKPIPESAMSSDSDFFFMGNNAKESIASFEDFIWDDFFLFLVRKVDGKWFLKGFAG